MPYQILKKGRKYELRLIRNNQLLGTHTTKKGVEAQIKAIEINKTSDYKKKGLSQYVKQPEEIIEKIKKIKEKQPSIIEKIYRGKGQTQEPFKKIGKYTYYLSDKPKKKLMTIVNGKKIYFGDTAYQHFRDKTSLLNPELSHYDDTRRKRYISRHSKIEDKDGNLVIFNPESPAYHSLNILW